MLIDRIVDARVDGHDELVDLVVVDGRVERIDRCADAPGATLDVGGRVVVPAFVDPHVHLDKAYLLPATEEASALRPDLASALAAVAGVRPTTSPAELHGLGRRALATLSAAGVTAARAHVELDPAVGLDLVDLHLTLAAEHDDRIHLQGVAFPQPGLEDPRVRDLMVGAMEAGLEVVGGCPYLDDDPGRHLDFVFGLAERFGAPVDLHLDFSGDPASTLIPLVTERTVAHGMQGRVAIGHVTTLAAMDDVTRAAMLDDLAAAGVALIALPATDLYLTGQGDSARRAIAPIAEAHAAGVLVAVGNNNIANPFAPFGNASPLHAAWLAGIAGQASGPADRALLLDAITEHPARILGLEPRGPEPGAVADLVVADTTAPDEVVRTAPTVLCTTHRGALVHHLDRPVLTTR